MKKERKTRQDKHWCPTGNCGKRLSFFKFITLEEARRTGLFKCSECQQTFIKSNPGRTNPNRVEGYWVRYEVMPMIEVMQHAKI